MDGMVDVVGGFVEAGFPGGSAKKKNLCRAKKAKNDEFYTQLTDIEKELRHYREHFEGKTVFCNCDDPDWSNFWKYFSLNFDRLGLKKLVSTHYEQAKPSYKMEMVREADGGTRVTQIPLKQNGDFRSDECIAILGECDIVVTNPPFSLFREYISTLVNSGKKFLIIGNNNAITYKEVFKHIKDGNLWLGHVANKTMEFMLSDEYEKYNRIDAVTGKKYGKVPAVSWFTNLPHKKRNEHIILYKKHLGNESEYPKYDNYDAIEVSKVAEIPMDYDGVMGVPITFLDKHNPEQFEIVGMATGRDEFEARPTKRYQNPKQINGDGPVTNGSKANTGATLLCLSKPRGVCYSADNASGYFSVCYARILIKNRLLSKGLQS